MVSEEKITLSPAFILILGFLSLANFDKAESYWPCEPATIKQILFGGKRITSFSLAVNFSGIDKYFISDAKRVFSFIDLPKKTIFRLNLIAASTQCLILEIFEEKVVIRNFPFVFRISSSK